MKIIPEYSLEKIEATLRNLSYIAEFLNDASLSEDDRKDRIVCFLGLALRDFTKAVSSLTQTEWTGDEAALFISEPVKGLEKLLVKYGRLSATKEDRIRALEIHLAEQCQQFLEIADRAPARTQLHELLRRYPTANPIIESLRDELEKVHQGQNAWNEFRIEAMRGVSELRKQLQG
jgi:hypothetical protein